MNSLQIFSTRRSKGFFLAGLGAALAAALVVSLLIGSVKADPRDIFAALQPGLSYTAGCRGHVQRFWQGLPLRCRAW